MQKQLYREKTVERIKSPEQLQDYMRVTNPGIWMILAAVIVMLAGFIVASALVRIETSLSVKGRVDENGTTVVMELSGDKKATVSEGMPVHIAGRNAKVSFLYENGDTLYVTAALDEAGGALSAGVYDAEIVTETIRPIDFLIG